MILSSQVFTDFYFLPRSCLFCGSFSALKNFYCSDCLQKLVQKINPRQRKIRTPNGDFVDVFSLFDWIPSESDLLSETILGLKGTQRKQQWKCWAKTFLRHHWTSAVNEETILVTCWNKTSRPEHAEIFGRALRSALNDKPKLEVLCQRTQPQALQSLAIKKLSRLERKNFIQSHEIFSKADLSDPKQNLIFIDDIVTTGSTVETAYRFLNRPKNFQVWCLAYRMKAE